MAEARDFYAMVRSMRRLQKEHASKGGNKPQGLCDWEKRVDLALAQEVQPQSLFTPKEGEQCPGMT